MGDYGGLRPELKLALLQAGLQEQARRDVNRSLTVAKIALAFAALTLVASIVLTLVR